MYVSRTLPLALGVLIASCAADHEAPSATDESSGETAALVQRVYEAFESGDNAFIDSVLAEDFVEHEELPGLSPDREGVKAFIGMWHSAFPDFNIEVHHVITQDDMSASHATFRGTHTGGEFLGVAATGREVAVPTVDIIRFANGRAVEHWGVSNEAALLRQLGLMPDDAAPVDGAPSDAAAVDTSAGQP